MELRQKWWHQEDIEEDELKVRVVLICKKGDTNKFENYRPISLLSTLYKLFAAVIKERISETLDKHFQKTQYGFRKNKSTADAIHLIRRKIEYGESTQNQLHLVLRDWEKAFDKVFREELHTAMERMDIHPKLVRLVQSVYKDTKFKVELDGFESDWQTRRTGIRQGCPLSPYLLLIVMTAMFEDVRKKVDSKLKNERVPAADFDEVTYADDTICFSTSTKAINLFIKEMEPEGFRYGLKLNKNKCELITTHQSADVHFDNKQKIPKVRLATDLGCNMGIKTNSREELSKSFANTMMTMKKLDIFWRHSNCGIAIKIYTADVILRSKLLYGLESAQLILSVANRMETFQLKVLRKIFQMDTTSINRGHTNDTVYLTANNKMQEQGKKKEVIKFTEVYKKLKEKLAAKPIDDPNGTMFSTTFKKTKLEKWTHTTRRVGKPRQNWAENTVAEIWEELKNNSRYRFQAFEHENEEKVQAVKEYAKQFIK